MNTFFPSPCVCCENHAHLESHLKMKTAKVGPLFLVVRQDESGGPLPRGETSARLMRRAAVRQSSSSLRLWCLSMIPSMIQNILKYRTVIIGLQNAHLRVLGDLPSEFFRGRGSHLPRRQNSLKACCLCTQSLTDCLLFMLSYDDSRARIIVLIQHCYVRLIIFCLHM